MRPLAEQEFTKILPSKYLDLSNDLRALTLEIMEQTIHKARWSDFMPNNGMAKFARALAKDLKRPFIPYFGWSQGGGEHQTFKGMSVEIPNVQYLRPIAAPLLLVSRDIPGNIYWSRRFNDDAPVISHGVIKSYTTFYFRGQEGLEIFNNWLSRTQNDPDMRKALKLPPK